MPIGELLDDYGNKYIGYSPISSIDSWKKANELYSAICFIASMYGVRKNELLFDWVVIGNIIERIEQRKVYYRIYHKNTELCEIRQVALLAYWIIRYRPFNCLINGKICSNIKLNENIAYHMIIGALVGLKTKNKPNYFVNFSQEYKRKIIHTFSEHDVSKELIILIAESLNETF